MFSSDYLNHLPTPHHTNPNFPINLLNDLILCSHQNSMLYIISFSVFTKFFPFKLQYLLPILFLGFIIYNIFTHYEIPTKKKKEQNIKYKKRKKEKKKKKVYGIEDVRERERERERYRRTIDVTKGKPDHWGR
jgi:hypothetical protein